MEDDKLTAGPSTTLGRARNMVQLASLSERWRFLVPCLWILAAVGCGSGNSAEASFEANLIASTKVTAKIAYDVIIDDPSGEVEVSNAVIVAANRPPDRRVDIYRDGEKESFILLAGELIECRDDICRPVTEDSRQSALDWLSFVDVSIGFSDLLSDEGTQDLDVRALPHRTIVGLDAECFEARWPGVITETCFSATGVLLLNDLRNPERGLGGSVQATSVQFEVSDEDLSPETPVEGLSPSQ